MEDLYVLLFKNILFYVSRIHIADAYYLIKLGLLQNKSKIPYIVYLVLIYNYVRYEILIL